MLEKIVNNLKGIDVVQLMLQVLNEHETQIKELIHMQLRQGVRGDGQIITPQYSEAYANKKRRTIPDLKLSGEFWDNIQTEINGEVLDIFSVRKAKGFDLAKHLEQRYTSKIYELTKASQEKLSKIIQSALYKKLEYEIYK